MKILNDVVSGAARQFGREFGRAGANSILKGANSYTISGISDYSGRIKPSDSAIVKGIKKIKKVNFVSTNKANISRLIDITDLVNSSIAFKGDQTLNEINDIKELINQYDEKFNHGSSLVDDDYEDKSLDYLKQRRQQFLDQLESFNSDIKNHVSQRLEMAKAQKKSKRTAVLLGIPLLGLQWAYLKAPGYTFLSIILCWTIIVPFINLIFLFKLLFMNESKFDLQYNQEFVYYSKFKVSQSD